MANEKYIRVKSGAIYGYCDVLAARSDAVVVGKKEYDEYMKEQLGGITAGKRGKNTGRRTKSEPKPEPKSEAQPVVEDAVQDKKPELEVSDEVKGLLDG